MRVTLARDTGAEELGRFLANFALTYSNLTAQANFSEIFARCARRQICDQICRNPCRGQARACRRAFVKSLPVLENTLPKQREQPAAVDARLQREHLAKVPQAEYQQRPQDDRAVRGDGEDKRRRPPLLLHRQAAVPRPRGADGGGEAAGRALP